MGAFAALIIGLGIIALIYGVFQYFKAGRMNKAPFLPTGEAAAGKSGDKGAVSVQGNVDCQQPLVSPVTGTPCLYYELKVIGSWKEGDASKSKDYIVEKVAAPFALDDGSGKVAIDANKGGEFDTKQTFDESKNEGFFADLKNAIGTPEPIMFGNYAFPNPPMSKANRFRCVEKVFPMPAGPLYAMGKLQEGTHIITTPGWTSLVLSPKSRDELLGSTMKHAKFAFIGGGAAAAMGAILGVVSTFL